MRPESKKIEVIETSDSAKPNNDSKDFIIGEFYDKNTYEYITLRFRTFGEAQSFEKLNRDVLRWIDFYES